MKKFALVFLLLAVVAPGMRAQVVLRLKNSEETFPGPKPERLTTKEWNDRQWVLMTETMPSDTTARKNVVASETTPFRSRRSVWVDQTISRRAAEFGSGPLTDEADSHPTPHDRWMASQLPEADFPGQAEDNAILAAVYRYFFTYRSRGFAKDSTVYFLGLGPHETDAPPSVLDALQADAVLKKDGVQLRPVSKSMEITADGIRDRDTGAYGPVFRVDRIEPEKAGRVAVVATFSERDGFWFTRRFTLARGKSGWEVVKDENFSAS